MSREFGFNESEIYRAELDVCKPVFDKAFFWRAGIEFRSTDEHLGRGAGIRTSRLAHFYVEHESWELFWHYNAHNHPLVRAIIYSDEEQDKSFVLCFDDNRLFAVKSETREERYAALQELTDFTLVAGPSYPVDAAIEHLSQVTEKPQLVRPRLLFHQLANLHEHATGAAI